MPLVSVVMPVLDAAGTVRAAARSILAEDDVDLELLVVDNGSTDGTVSLVRELDDHRVRLLGCQDRGIVPALNTGLAACSGAFVGRMDADDISVPGRLAKQVARLQADPSLSLVGTWFDVFREDPKDPVRISALVDSDGALRRRLLTGNPFAHGTLMFRRSSVGAYGEDAPFAEDYALILECAARGGLAVVPEVLYHWREHAGSSTASVNRRTAAERVRAGAWMPDGLVDDERTWARPFWAGHPRNRVLRWNTRLLAAAIRRGRLTTAARLLALSGASPRRRIGVDG